MTNCYGSSESSFYTLEYNIFVEANQRIRDVAAVKYIKCIVDNLIDNANATKAVWESGCNFTMEDYPADYNNTVLYLPGRDNCTLSTDNDPSDGDLFFTQEYQSFLDEGPNKLNVFFANIKSNLCPSE